MNAEDYQCIEDIIDWIEARCMDEADTKKICQLLTKFTKITKDKTTDEILEQVKDRYGRTHISGVLIDQKLDNLIDVVYPRDSGSYERFEKAFEQKRNTLLSMTSKQLETVLNFSMSGAMRWEFSQEFQTHASMYQFISDTTLSLKK